MTVDVEQIQRTFIEECENVFRETFSFLRGKRVYIYGSGIFGSFLRKALVDYGCVESVFAYINDFENGFDKDDIPVVPLEQINCEGDDYCIVVGVEKYEGIVSCLKAKKICYYVNNDFCFDLFVQLMYHNLGKKPLFTLSDIKQRIIDFHYNSVLSNLDLSVFYEDEISKQVIRSRIDFYETGCVDYLKNAPINCKEYFDSSYLDISKNECYLDLGAFDGDSILEFSKYVDGSYNKIIAFEPDTKNFEKMKGNLSTMENVVCFPYASGSENGSISFASGGGVLSGICESGGGASVRLVKLDDFINEPLSLVKMDIEGAELDTLKGMERLIRENRPKMIICVYHKVEDLYTIPKFLKSVVPEYHLKLRQHKASILETVLYAEV